MSVSYVILDTTDGTFHYGDGVWGVNAASAQRHTTRLDAVWELDEVDCAELLRDRLTVVTMCDQCGGVGQCIPLLARSS